jgi:mitogen-activated protein kinase kinase kinase
MVGTLFLIKLLLSLSPEHGFSSLTNRLLGDVMRDYIASLKVPSEAVVGGIEVKYTKLLHTMRMRARKLLQFAR